MMIDNVKQVLSKFRKNDLITIVSNYKNFDSEYDEDYTRDFDPDDNDNYAGMTKERIVDSFTKKHMLTEETLATLSLRLVHIYSFRRKWAVYKINLLNELLIESMPQSPSDLREVLQEELSLYFLKVNVCVAEMDERKWLWIRLHCVDTMSSGQSSVEDTMYAVYCPCFPYLVFSKIKARFKAKFEEALMKVFDATSLEERQLSGYSIQSLLQLAAYRENPEAADERMPDRQHLPPVHQEVVHPHLRRHDRSRRLQRQQEVDQYLGVKELPELQRLEYQFETKFRGFRPKIHKDLSRDLAECGLLYAQKCPDGPRQLCRSRVTFRGSSVLEGYRAAMERGFGKIPIPKMIRDVRFKAENRFFVKDR